MAATMADDEFPITFDVEGQNVHAVFKDKDTVVEFLEAERGFWAEVSRASKSSVMSDSVDILVQNAGLSSLNTAYGAVRRTDDPQVITNILSGLETSVALFAAGDDGILVRAALEEDDSHVFGMVLAAVGANYRAFGREQVQGRRASLDELIVAADGASTLAARRSLPKNKRAEIGRVISTARERLKETETKQREIDSWFEAHRVQLDKVVADATNKSTKLGETYQDGFSRALENSDQAADMQSKQMIGNYKSLTETFSKEITELHDSTQARLKSIEDLYTNKLVLNGPSNLWRTVRNRARNMIIGALLLFAILLVAPAWAVMTHWENISAFLIDLIASSPTGFSLTAVAALTIPTLGYGWLLRHISRVFVHNLNLMSDAEYREVLATTFLGLAEQKSAGVTEAERVLVLNALFRPAPPHAPEDGPPVGLLDLLGKKP